MPRLMPVRAAVRRRLGGIAGEAWSRRTAATAVNRPFARVLDRIAGQWLASVVFLEQNDRMSPNVHRIPSKGLT